MQEGFRHIALAVTLLILRFVMMQAGMEIPWWVIVLIFIITGAHIDDD